MEGSVIYKRSAPKGDKQLTQFQKRRKRIKLDKILPPLEKIQHPSKFLVYKKIEDRFLKSLRYLNLSDSGLKSIILLTYMDLRQLQNLNLNNNFLSSLRGLQKCNLLKLEILYVRYNYLKKNQAFHLCQLPRIQHIYLNENCIADLQTFKLWQMCPDLMKVVSLGNPIVKQKWDYHRNML